MQDMPIGPYTRRREENHFKRETSIRMATKRLELEAHQRNIVIRHNMNDTKKRIGNRQLPVDGFHGPSSTVFQFHCKIFVDVYVIACREGDLLIMLQRVEAAVLEKFL